MTLAELEYGEVRVIQELAGPEEVVLSLQELGFVPGSEVELVARSLFMSPLAYRIKGTVFALRKNEAECIQV